MNKFNTFHELAFDTKQKLLSFCDYAPKTLSRYDSIVRLFEEAMDGSKMIFSFSRIRSWIDCFIAFNNYRDYTYKRYRRVLLLLNDNYIVEAGPWRVFPSVHRPVPESADLLAVSNAYEDYLQSCGYAEKTICIRMSFACRFLCVWNRQESVIWGGYSCHRFGIYQFRSFQK